MNRAHNRISLALAVAAGMFGAAFSPAFADGDPYYSNGINPSGVRTPVPAPIPVPIEEADWYFRGDFAAGFGGSPSVNVLGTNLVETIFSGSSQSSQSFEPSFTGGVGVGYVWSPNWRTDFTVDIHSIMHTEETGEGTALVGSTPTYGVAEDKTKMMSTILMLNGYYDFRTGSPWTPYLGAGLGFSVNQLTQSYTESASYWGVTGSQRSTDVAFAAAAMVGVSYDFSSFFAIDVNYRFLHIGGSEVTLNEIALPTSTVEIGDINEHQIRAGFRFYVN
ncbi:MAG: outer membrane beta-barrel protein [Hyphomicrobium sp.]|jgi:opacity protein-like surface antigen